MGCRYSERDRAAAETVALALGQELFGGFFKLGDEVYETLTVGGYEWDVIAEYNEWAYETHQDLSDEILDDPPEDAEWLEVAGASKFNRDTGEFEPVAVDEFFDEAQVNDAASNDNARAETSKDPKELYLEFKALVEKLSDEEKSLLHSSSLLSHLASAAGLSGEDAADSAFIDDASAEVTDASDALNIESDTGGTSDKAEEPDGFASRLDLLAIPSNSSAFFAADSSGDSYLCETDSLGENSADSSSGSSDSDSSSNAPNISDFAATPFASSTSPAADSCQLPITNKPRGPGTTSGAGASARGHPPKGGDG